MADVEKATGNFPGRFFKNKKASKEAFGLKLQEDFNNVDWEDPKLRQRGPTMTSTPAMDLDSDWT